MILSGSIFRKRFLYALAGLFLFLAISPAAAEDRALIIGVDQYPQWPERSQLTGAVNDARVMARVARDVWGFKPEQIKLLLNEDGTASGILGAIESWLIDGTREGDRVLITYSGHGYYAIDQNGDEPDGRDETLAPYDVYTDGGTFHNMVSDDEISRLLDRLAGRDVMMMVDSCYSGTITRALNPRMRKGPSIVRSIGIGRVTRGMSKKAFDTIRRDKAFLEPRPNMMVWTAVAASEKAQEDMSLPASNRNGVFTRSFAEGLVDGRADANRNGIITAAELLAYVRARAVKYCEKQACATGMTPTLEAPAGALARDMTSWRAAQPVSAVANPMVSTPPPSPPVQVAADDVITQGNALAIKVEILPRARVRVGDRIRVRVTSPKPGYLVLLDVRENGEVRQLFPSKCARKERRLRANAPLTMPDPTYGCVFEADEAGKGQLLAIVTEDNVPLEDLLQRNRDLEIVPNGDAFLAALAQQLMAVWTGDERNRPVRWALAKVRYEVGE